MSLEDLLPMSSDHTLYVNTSVGTASMRLEKYTLKDSPILASVSSATE